MSDTDRERRTYTSEHIARDADQFVFLDNEVLDGLVTTVLELSAELWALRRRGMIVERLLERGKPIAPGAIETYVPTAEDVAEWQSQRDGFVERIMAPLARTGQAQGDAPRHEFMD